MFGIFFDLLPTLPDTSKTLQACRLKLSGATFLKDRETFKQSKADFIYRCQEVNREEHSTSICNQTNFLRQ